MIFKRSILPTLLDSLLPGKVVVLYGPRQVGKTTLCQELIRECPFSSKFINADELMFREVLSSQNSQKLGEILSDAELLVIDEAQRVPEIGLNLKLMVDSFPNVRIIATGSSSFDLANRISEPLTGRALTYTLFPISFTEISNTLGKLEARSQLERWLIWGGYPAISANDNPAFREQLLGNLVGSYLYKDILEMDGIRRSDKIVNLLRLLAFQIGNEVSIAELATSLALHRQTVERYLDLLEKSFVIFRVDGFSRNLRKEITKNSRYYFYDNGVRNSLIQNFNPLNLRQDIGQIWENYLMVERRKNNQHFSRSVNTFFWRTYDQKEIDCIEEYGGRLYGYEFKWNAKEIRKSVSNEFKRAYPISRLQSIHRENFEDFITK